MSLLNEDIKYYVTGDDKVLFERDIFTELVRRIHSLEKNDELCRNTNFILNRRNDKMTELCWNIRDYLITCKQDKSKVDIDMLIDWLN